MKGELTKVDRDQDFAAWCEQTAQALERKEFTGVDWDGVVEEIRDLGKNDHRELRHRLRQLMAHLLKWEFQPEKRSGSWAASIREQRASIADLLAQSPSLKPEIPKAVREVWKDAVGLAADETGLAPKVFPSSCPYEIHSQVLNQTWLPEAQP